MVVKKMFAVDPLDGAVVLAGVRVVDDDGVVGRAADGCHLRVRV